MTINIENTEETCSSEKKKKKRKFEENEFSQHSTENTNLTPQISDTRPLSPTKRRISENQQASSLENPESSRQETKIKRLKKIHKPDSNNYPTITCSKDCRLNSQIKISDLQSLILYILADGKSPNFVSIRHRMQIRKVVALMVPGLELSMFNSSHSQNSGLAFYSPDYYYPKKLEIDQLSDSVKLFADMFDYVWPVKTPGDDRYMKMHNPLHVMLTVPLTKTEEEKREQKRRRGHNPVKEPHGWCNKPVTVTNLVHTADELLENDYVLHPVFYSDEKAKSLLIENRRSIKASKEYGWVDSHVSSLENDSMLGPDNESKSSTAGWKVLAMDCEMCLTGEDESSLTRISILEWNGSVVLDELVKPDKPITNYLTQYSGITKEKLENVTTSLVDIQKKLLKLLHSCTILVGHSLNSDLAALKITHPHIIDTAILYPHPRGPPLKSSLKMLAKLYLSREIQKGHGATGPVAGHDSIEDAKTCLDLVKKKCEKGKEWGISSSQRESIFKRISRAGTSYNCQVSSDTDPKSGKSSAVVDWGNPSKGSGASANFSISCNSDEEVMKGVIRAVNGDDDGKEIPGCGIDFTWGRLRELEAFKGWWNNTRQGMLDNTPNKNEISERIDSDIDLAIKAKNSASIMSSSSSNTSLDSSDILSKVTADLSQRIYKIYSALPPCTAFIIYSGSGNPTEMNRLQSIHTTFKREYKTKKWDQLSVKWTDVEEQALRKAHITASNGLGFIGIK